MGLNTAEVYVFWNWHEEVQGQVDWESPGRDISQFLRLADKHGLSVALRAGPYGCGEWDNGGLPAWMMSYKFMNGSSEPGSWPLEPQYPLSIRTNDTRYLAFVDGWMEQLLGKIKSEGHLYADGGNVIMVQLENEYGSFGNVQSNPGDLAYMEHLVSIFRKYLGSDVVLYTTDGGNLGYMSRGSLNGSAVYTVGDTGPGSGYKGAFEAQAEFNPPGSRSNFISEWYTGWLMQYGGQYPNKSTGNLIEWTNAAFNDSGSIALYMAHGGTNWGWYNGANGGGDSITIDTASYDYNAPLAEWGAHNWGSDGKDKYAALRTLYTEWAKRDGQPLPPAEPAPRPIEALGEVKFTHVLPLLSGASRDHFCPAGVPGRRVSGLPQPVAMEHPLLNQSQGIAVYEAELPPTAGSSQQLQFGSTEPRDYAVVSVGSDTQGTVFRTGNKPIPVSWPAASSGNNPSVLTIVMENMGHINYGHGMFDLKGLLSVPTIGGSSNATAANWSVCSMPMSGDDVAKAEPLFQPVSQGPPTGVPQLPAFLMGEFQAKASPATGKPPSTFLSVSGWGKGVAWVNGFALGRHWVSRGPQNALYVPESVLVEGTNTLVLLEEEALPVSAASGNNGRLGNNYEGLSVQLTDAPDFHGPSACNPLASAPMDGSNVVMYECRADLAKHQQWSLSAGGKLQVGDGSLGLCASAGPGKDPDGQPSVELSKCSGGSTQPEDWSYDSGSQALKVSPGGACMDITAHLSNNGANVETYSCNGGSNQQWSQPPAAGSPGAITSKQDGHCLTVCPPQSASK